MVWLTRWAAGQLEAGEGVPLGPRPCLRQSPTANPLPQGRFQCRKRRMAGLQELAGQATHLFYRKPKPRRVRECFLGAKKGIRISPIKPGWAWATSAGWSIPQETRD